MEDRAGKGWSVGGQASLSSPWLETNIGVATWGYVQLGLSLPGEVRVRVAAGFFFFPFLFSFFL